MRASPSAVPSREISSLQLGERTIAQSDEGLLGAEYSLFDAADIVLRATDPVSVREAGYITTAREALERLARSGVTRGLADAAARSLSAEAASSFARGAAARGVVGRLGAHELFDGAIYRARASHYEGAWLDLAALSARLAVPAAPILLQVLHLAAALSEVAASTPVHLSTEAVTRHRRPGERTHSRVDLDGVLRIPDALVRLTPRLDKTEPDASHDRRMRRALVARVRERMNADASDRLKGHLNGLEAALAPRTMEIGALSDPELQSVERQLATGDASGIDEQLDEFERNHGPGAGIRYLRARAAMLRGERAPGRIAQFLSDIAENGDDFHQTALRAARTWLAAGDEANARYFAQRLVEDTSASDGERLVALEILDATNPGRPNTPVPPHAETPSRQSQPPRFATWGFPSSSPPAARPMTLGLNEPTPPPVYATPQEPTSRPREATAAKTSEPPHGAVTPTNPAIGARTTQRPRSPKLMRYEPELAESLTLPAGASESALGVNEAPRAPLEARIVMTRLARHLGRDYRQWYGKALRCNVLAVDAMQQHLTQHFAGVSIADPAVAMELRRHGALLSEIIARALGGTWTDIAPTEPGYWAMVVPSGIRTWPIGRVFRFVALGHREKDLVGYYLDLEAKIRALDE